MTEVVKYKFRSNYNGEVSKYNIRLTKNANWGKDVTLKDKSGYLLPEYRSKKVLNIEDFGNCIVVDMEGHTIELDACQESYLLAALWARAVDQGNDVSINKVLNKSPIYPYTRQ